SGAPTPSSRIGPCRRRRSRAPPPARPDLPDSRLTRGQQADQDADAKGVERHADRLIANRVAGLRAAMARPVAHLSRIFSHSLTQGAWPRPCGQNLVGGALKTV